MAKKRGVSCKHFTGQPTITLVPFKDTTQLDNSPCPECGKRLNAAAHVSSLTMPLPGDVVVCLYCGAMLEYDALLHTVPLSKATQVSLASHQPEEWAYMLAMQKKFRSSAEKFVIRREPKVQ